MKISDTLLFDLPTDAVVALFGYGAGRKAPARFLDTLEKMRELCFSLAQPRGTYAVYEIAEAKNDGVVMLGGREFSGKILSHVLSGSEMVALSIVTIGDKVEKKASELAEGGDLLASIVLDALGSLSLVGASSSLMGDIFENEAVPRGYSLTSPFGPGQCQWDIKDQRTLFSLVRGESVGVILSPSYLMIPKKSVSSLIGLGPKDAISRITSCEVCNRKDCPGRKMLDLFGKSHEAR